MTEISREAYKKIQEVARFIYKEFKTQIEPSSVRVRVDQLPNDTLNISETELEKALKYLSKEGLITYKCDKIYSATFDEYDEKYKEAYELAQSPEYIFTTNKQKQDKIWRQVNLYDKWRKNEAKRWHSTVFIVKPLPNFEAECRAILSRYNDTTRYKLTLGGSEKNILYVNGKYKLHKFHAEWQLQLMKRALSSTNGTPIKAPKDTTKGMPQLLPDIIGSKILRELFFLEKRKNSFVIRHTITDKMIKDEQLDTKKIESELKKTLTNTK